MDRKTLDRLVSGSGLVVAVVLVLLGAVAIYGGSFGRDNVRNELVPQHIQFPPAEAMTPEETAEVGEFAGQKVENGVQAEGFARYIGLHLADVNDGKTYSETSAEARALDPEDPAKAEKDAQVMTLFRGETLKGLLLGAYGWWTIATLALFAGYGLIAFGIVLAIFAALGFRHAKKVELKIAKPEKVAA